MTKPAKTSPSGRRAPPRHKLAILSFLGLLGPVYLIPPVIQAVLPVQRLLIDTLVVAVIVLLMSYIIMPLLQWLFRGWLAPAGRSDGSA